MTTTQASTLDRPQTTDDDDEDLTHIYCKHCMPDAHYSLCGKDLTNDNDLGEYDGPRPDDCIVCVDLFKTHICHPHH